jgi:hypothetical protein
MRNTNKIKVMNNKQKSKMVIGSNGQLEIETQFQFVSQFSCDGKNIKAQPNEVIVKVDYDDIKFWIMMNHDEDREYQTMVMPIIDSITNDKTNPNALNTIVKHLLYSDESNMFDIMFTSLMKKMDIEVEDGMAINMFEAKIK